MLLEGNPSVQMKPQCSELSLTCLTAELQNYYAFHILFMPPFSAHLEWNTEVIVLDIACEEHVKKNVLCFNFHSISHFWARVGESQYDPLHTLSPGVCTSCLSPDETNEAATWWPTLHHWIHPPKTNGWNLKMMISKAGSSFSWGVHFQVNQPLVFGGVHKTETLSCWRPKNWRCQASFPLRLLKVDPPQDRNRWKENLFAKISWNSNETSNYSESSKLFKKFTRSQTGPVSPWGIS